MDILFFKVLHTVIVILIHRDHQSPVLPGDHTINRGTRTEFLSAPQILHPGTIVKVFFGKGCICNLLHSVGEKRYQTGFAGSHFHVTSASVLFFQLIFIICKNRVSIRHQIMINFTFCFVNFRKIIIGKTVGKSLQIFIYLLFFLIADCVFLFQELIEIRLQLSCGIQSVDDSIPPDP